MIYIPMFKGRKFEVQTIGKVNGFFSDNIIPLVEIVSDHYGKTEFEIDSITGKEIKEKRGNRMQRKRRNPTDEDVDTFVFYSQQMGYKKAFIDYFRFNPEVYKNNFKPASVSLSLRLNQDEQLYINRLKSVSNLDNFIPVLSIKKDYYPAKYKLNDLITELQSNNDEIAVRLDESAYDNYANTVAKKLRASDFLMYDIGQQKTSSKVVELAEVESLSTDGKKIVLNSPRIREINNDAYENRKLTLLIDNSARQLTKTCESISGYGDYCGLKDYLTPGGGKGGRALALLYQYDDNKFMAYLNSDVEAGCTGFSELIPQIVKDSPILDAAKTCPVIAEIKKMSSSGGWGIWIRLICTRYLHQMYSNI